MELASNPHRNREKAEKVRRMFGAIARRYDLNNTLHSFGRDAAWRREAVRMAGVRAGDEILDAACGTGALTRAFGAAEPRPARVVGLDFTPEMLDIARTRPVASTHCATPPPLVQYVQGDAMALPFEDASFDVVSIAFGLRNVADPALAIAEFRRVLRAGGRLIVLEFGVPRNAIVARLNQFYCGTIMPITASLIARDRSGAYAYLPRSVGEWATPEETARLMESVGFARTVLKRMTCGVCACIRAEI